MNKNRLHVPSAATAGTIVVAASLGGGALAITTHLNTAAEAFSNKAELAAPWPTLLLQILAVLAIIRWRDWRGVIGASSIAVTGLLGLAAIGDDETFKNGLPTWACTVQALIIGVSAAAVIPCLAYIRRIRRERRCTQRRPYSSEPAS